MKPPGVRFDQRRVGFEHAEDGVFVVPVECPHQLFAGSGLRVGLGFILAAVFFLLNDRDDFVVTAIPRDDESRGGGAMWPDAFACVGSALHQQADHFGQTSVHGVMEDLMLVFVRHVGAYKVGSRIENWRTRSASLARVATASWSTVKVSAGVIDLPNSTGCCSQPIRRSCRLLRGKRLSNDRRRSLRRE